MGRRGSPGLQLQMHRAPVRDEKRLCHDAQQPINVGDGPYCASVALKAVFAEKRLRLGNAITPATVAPGAEPECFDNAQSVRSRCTAERTNIRIYEVCNRSGEDYAVGTLYQTIVAKMRLCDRHLLSSLF